jgi:hypothetical protein
LADAAFAVRKFADTAAADLSVRVQVGFGPRQTPPHPTKTEPASGTAVRVIFEPACRFAVQLSEQDGMPSTPKLTVPLPRPCLV